ncbi:MAG: AzlC family ABC transporter permease [Solirubrobacteraceae bacterium]
MLGDSWRDGVRAGLPVAVPTLTLGVVFGVLAKPVMGTVAPIVMSTLVFSGAAQFAALSVLGAGGGVLAASLAGVLLNVRWLAMGFAVAPSLPGRAAARALRAQAIVDASFAISSRGDGTFDSGRLVGATIPQVTAWITGTIVGVFSGALLSDPKVLGLDAIFPAFYLSLLAAELRSHPAAGRRQAALAAVGGGAVTLGLMSFAPPGVPLLGAAVVALIGLRRT